MLNNHSEDDMPVQNSSDESYFLTNDESQSSTPDRPASFSPNSSSLFQTGIQNSWLWKQPKIISQINLKLFGVKFDSDRHVYQQLLRQNLFSCSKDGKYFIFANKFVVYIFKCIEGWLAKKLKYKKQPNQLHITSDSQYLIVVLDSWPQYKTKKFKVYGLEDLKKYFVKKRETDQNIGFEVKFKQFYAMFIDLNNQITIEIFNVYNGQSINVIYPLRDYFRPFFLRSFVLNEHVYLLNTQYLKGYFRQFSCFLQLKNGKVLKRTNQYEIIYDLFGLDTDVFHSFCHIYSLYYVKTGKLLKKIKVKIHNQPQLRPDIIHHQINLIKLKNELLIQVNFSHHELTPLKFYTVELKCFRFERSRPYYYYKLEQINENRAFEIYENGVIKFYQF